MRRAVAVASLLLAVLSSPVRATQDKREQGTYKEVREMLGELVQQRNYAEAAALLERVLDRFPDHLVANTYNLAAVRVLMGQHEKAMQALEDGLHRGVFYSEVAFDGELMSSLKKQPRFPAFQEQNLIRLREAQRRTTMKLEVVTPPGYDAGKRYPLFVALHGGGENVAIFRPNWVSPRLQAEFIIAYVQSSQVADMTTFHWQDEALTRRDLEAAYEKVIATYPIDRSRVVVGGFSSGGFASLVTAFHQFLPVRGFVALCPEVPVSIRDEEIRAAVRRGLRGSLLTTEQDGRIEAQRALADHWKALGLDAEFIVTPNIGHWYPADFARQLDRAIGRIVARRRARSSDARDRHERAPSRRQLCH